MTQHYSKVRLDSVRDPNHYETTDCYLASFLKASGYSLAGLGRSGNRTVFRFEDKPERSRDILAFYNGEGSVFPLSLISAIREMKALIHSVG